MIFLPILLSIIVYALSLSNSIYGGDAGDLVSAILTRGFAHPPGYSLYAILGMIANRIPLQFLSPAGKVTLISLAATSVSLYLFVKISRELFLGYKYTQSRLILIYGVVVLALNYIVWLYAAVPEVFPLNTMLILIIYYASLRYYATKKIIFLYLISFIVGIALSHHHTFILSLPAVLYLLIQSNVVKKLRFKHLVGILFVGIIGLLPNIQLILGAKQTGAVVWGSANSLRDLASVFLREGYGTFTAGSFVTQLPIHRLIQLKNLFLYTLNDFTLFGLIILFISCLVYLKEKDKERKVKTYSLLLNIIFFGPVFFFYANFPLSANFSFATLERFLHAFYFFYAMLIYGGLIYIFNFFSLYIRKLKNPTLRRVAQMGFLLLLAIYPLGQYLRNYKLIFSLKNNFIAENLGRDILMNASSPSIILLAGDTQLFNTQYVYYSNKELQKGKIIVHASKLSTNYYPENLAGQYPQLRLEGIKKTASRVNYLIKENKDRFVIYASDQYPLDLPDYRWVPSGILNKLEKKGGASLDDDDKHIQEFWRTSLNRNLEEMVQKKDPVLNNLFIRDILRVYSIGHQNSAFYYLQRNLPDGAYMHIQSSFVLQPDDSDNLFLLSNYYELKGDCTGAFNTIQQALNKTTDQLFLKQLKRIEENCFQDSKEKEKATRLRELYEQKLKKRLELF